MNKLLNIRFFLLLFAALYTVGVMAQKDNVVDEVVWVVGDEAIFKSDIEEYILSSRVEGESLPDDPYCVVAEQLALQQLFLHQAALDSIAVPEEQLMSRVNSEMERRILFFGGKEKMEEYFKKPQTALREELREAIRNQYLVQGVRDKITSKAKVTPAEVRNYVKNIPVDSIPFVPTQVEVELLVKNPLIPQSEIDRVKEELREYTERVNNGTPFSSLAILYSEDPGTARKGGELGLTPRGVLDPAFASVAFSLQDPKKVSKIVESEFGYHIIQLIEKRGDKINCRHILRRPKVSDEELNSTLLRLDSVANDIRENKFSFEAAVTSLSDDKDTHRSNGLMQNQETGTSRFEMDQLPQEVAKVVDKMNVNEVSKSFVMMNAQGKEVCAVVKLKARIPGHRANVSEDFSLLQNMVVNMKGQEALQQWIRDKQKKTFVRINENWKNCDFKYPDWKF